MRSLTSSFEAPPAGPGRGLPRRSLPPRRRCIPPYAGRARRPSVRRAKRRQVSPGRETPAPLPPDPETGDEPLPYPIGGRQRDLLLDDGGHQHVEEAWWPERLDAVERTSQRPEHRMPGGQLIEWGEIEAGVDYPFDHPPQCRRDLGAGRASAPTTVGANCVWRISRSVGCPSMRTPCRRAASAAGPAAGADRGRGARPAARGARRGEAPHGPQAQAEVEWSAA